MAVKKKTSRSYQASKEILKQATEQEKVRSTIYINKTTYEKFQRFSKKKNLSVSEFIESLMIDAMKDLA